MRDGTKLETLAEAGAFILACPKATSTAIHGPRRPELLMAAAERNGDIDAATKAVERAAFMQFIWTPGTAPRSKG